MKRQSSPFDLKTMSDLAGEILPDEMHELWTEYVQMRNRIAKTRIDTDASQKRIFKQLLNLSTDNDKRVCSLAQSIDFKWRGFFDPKNYYLKDFRQRKFEREKVIAEMNPASGHDTDVATKKEDPAERKKRMRDMVYKQAKKGSSFAKNLIKQWENPQIVTRAKIISQAEYEEDLRKKCAEDVKKGNIKPHTGGFSPIGSFLPK